MEPEAAEIKELPLSGGPNLHPGVRASAATAGPTVVTGMHRSGEMFRWFDPAFDAESRSTVLSTAREAVPQARPPLACFGAGMNGP